MKFSVTIVTCNRADRLAGGLAALASQEFDMSQAQVIVADNGSSDHTRDVAVSFAERFPNFHFIEDSRPGQLVGWHRALETASGEVTCFIDDDAYPVPTWLAALDDAYNDPAVGMATGPIEAAYEGTPPDWLEHMVLGEPGEQTLPFLGLLDAGSTVRDIPGNFVWGTNFSVRRALLYETGGFHPGAMPSPLIRFYGDAEIHVGRSVEAMGRRVVYHPGARVMHQIPDARLSLDGVRAKFVSAGVARSYQHLRNVKQPYELPSADEIAAIAARYFRDVENAPKELVDTVATGLYDGIQMHLTAFEEDSAFRDWVLQDSYLDLDTCYTHPDLKPLDTADGVIDWRVGDGPSKEVSR